MTALAPVTGDGRVIGLRESLRKSGFTGDFEDSAGARLVAGTDNSIYQRSPACIAYPRCSADINRLVRAALQDTPSLSLTARGGNTGTNGQSLNGGVVVDFARHMNRILSLDLSTRRVTVEPGVVLDQLNAALAIHGLFFPPTVSTASRATIGGMVATDASGKGSRRYGKTSHYIEALDLVLADGSDWRAEPMPRAEAERIARGTGPAAAIHREALRIVSQRKEDIARAFPAMNRSLTGYDLQNLYQEENDRFFLGHLLAGSEGTLALIKAITLRLEHKPAAKALAIVRYNSFDGALRDIPRLLEADPLAIEILDDKVIGAARDDIVWHGIEAVLGGGTGAATQAIIFVEFVGGTGTEVERDLTHLEALLRSPADSMTDSAIVRDPGMVARLWGLREKCVGLLARQAGEGAGAGRQGTPFVEDTAVPPENLADYVAEFRALLDGYGLEYGMFGHADVGCLHVRPFLDMKNPRHAKLIRPISDGVARLTKSYGGLLWGEHGRGFRGEYLPLFFGPVLYLELARIKRAFDPDNLFNPGKLVSPDRTPVDRIDAAPLRGNHDRQIAPAMLREFDRAVACNGNAACFSWDALDVMCPSYKATRDRAQSPKGRAALLRDWARLASIATPGAQEKVELREIENATAKALETCLGCKACTAMCPVRVDIPTMKSRFMERWHASRPRPLRDRFLTHAETLFAAARRAPMLANLTMRTTPARWFAERVLGMVDLPRVHPARARKLPPVASARMLAALPDQTRTRTVVLIEDSFTSTFDGRVVEAAGRVLDALGYTVFRLPARPNGKILYLLGQRGRFANLASKRARECASLAAHGVTLVGLDAATSLMFEHEYREFDGAFLSVIGLERLLAQDIEENRIGAARAETEGKEAYRLLNHCTEYTLRPHAAGEWVKVLGHLGARVQAERLGCCGMAGLFGHQAESQPISRRLFDMGWRAAIERAPGWTLATGFSCRAQAERLAGLRPRHPIELVDELVGRAANASDLQQVSP